MTEAATLGVPYPAQPQLSQIEEQVVAIDMCGEFEMIYVDARE